MTNNLKSYLRGRREKATRQSLRIILSNSKSYVFRKIKVLCFKSYSAAVISLVLIIHTNTKAVFKTTQKKVKSWVRSSKEIPIKIISIGEKDQGDKNEKTDHLRIF